jgi:hypothetical protein
MNRLCSFNLRLTLTITITLLYFRLTSVMIFMLCSSQIVKLENIFKEIAEQSVGQEFCQDIATSFR